MRIGRLNVQTAGSLPLIAGHWTGCFDCASYLLYWVLQRQE